jgi:hypothetical protein
MFLTGSVIMSLCRNLPDGKAFDVFRLAIVVPSAVVVYTLAAKLLHIEMLSLFTGKKNRQKENAG